MAEVARVKSEAGRDIAGGYPSVVDLSRKNQCRDSLRRFAETYFLERFHMSWSADHLKAIAKLETCVLDGGQFAYAMPRGTGKTTLAEVAALWSILYGHRRYVVMVGATQEHANNLVETCKNEIETNDLLYEDFPEACYPVRAMEGIAQRANGQLFEGERTRMDLKDGVMILPTLPKRIGSKCSGSVMEGRGLTGNIRGKKKFQAGGKQLRPDLVILDDPQTDESARSLTQNNEREGLINKACLGLAGPKTKIAAIMPCTVISPDDLADRLLDRERNPQWNGERTKMLYSFPSNMDLWDEYAERRRQSYRIHGDSRDSDAFYLENRAAMDAGCVVAWSERYTDKDASAIQFSMNWFIDRPDSFASECQNEPLRSEDTYGVKQISKLLVMERKNGIDRGIVPQDATRLTAFFDVGGELLWYAVVAWNEYFGGSVIDYGTFPKQNRSYFAKSDARPGLSDVYPGMTPSQRVYAGLQMLFADIMPREWPRQSGGGSLKIERALVDAGWGDTADAVYRIVTANPYPIYPSKGIGRHKDQVGVARWKNNKTGERIGHHWRLSDTETKRQRLLKFDPDAWKTFVHNAFSIPLGGKTSLVLHGNGSTNHELIATHLSAERSEIVTTKGDTYDGWSVVDRNVDNDWLDCLVGCAVAASVAGVAINATGSVEPNTKPRVLTQADIDRQMKERKTIRPGATR